jgi:hypothetical protein
MHKDKPMPSPRDLPKRGERSAKNKKKKVPKK